ncbi:hypothetical protein D915_005814 [Fasciola hepatica]|uniref:GTF3C1 extended winged-helix domain-containing protein n=1 Tax=Fasciola hepatica TaxID=6192 RepID=A0A4E0RSM9_FASHE|nr:hypothetical protein D915_005814 [Fasciola hepatica]
MNAVIITQFLVPKIHPVEEANDAGSCEYYHQRVDVSDTIRSSEELTKVSKAFSKWGERLVVVASFEKRVQLLLGEHCNLRDLSSGALVVLEVIAKMRFNGFPTTNFDGLLSCGLNNSTIWYARQKLEKLGLLKSQPYMSRYQNQPISSGLLLHHWRFYRYFPFSHSVIIEKIGEMVTNSKEGYCSSVKLRRTVGIAPNVFRRLMGFGEKFGLLISEKCMFKTLCAKYFNKNEEDLSNDEIRLFSVHVIASQKNNPAYVSIVRLARPFVRGTWRKIIEKAHHSSSRRAFDEDADCDSEAEETQQSMYEPDASGFTENDADVLSDDNPSAVLSVTSENNAKTSTSPVGVSGADKVNSLAVWRTSLAAAPHLDINTSLVVQVARILTPRMKQMWEVLKETQTDYFLARRPVVLFDMIGMVKTVKISSNATFILCRQLLTESERSELLRGPEYQGTTTDTNTPRAETSREKRRKFIIDYLAEHGLVTSVTELRHLIWNHEESLGLKMRMDRKSLGRILDDLMRAKEIVVHTVASVQGDMRFICRPDVSQDDPLVASAIHSLDLAFLKKRTKLEQLMIPSAEPVEIKEEPCSISDESMKMASMQLPRIPKGRRRCMIHEFLYYVVYQIPSDTKPIMPATDNLPPVYCSEESWARFVAPVSPPLGFQPGWFTMNEVFCAMPFGLYLQVLSPSKLPRILFRWLGMNNHLTDLTTAELERLDEELRSGGHPDLPLSTLLRIPMNRLQTPGGGSGRLYMWLTSQAKLNAMRRCMEELSLHNLIAVIERKSADGRTVPIAYLKRYASLVDTRYASPGHYVLTEMANCHTLRFDFKNPGDVSAYWETCEVICRYTPLGVRVLQDPLDINELPFGVMDYTSKPEEIVDDGSLPTLQWPMEIATSTTIDGLTLKPCGAAGLHPLDFYHRHQNWNLSRRALTMQRRRSKQVPPPSSSSSASSSSEAESATKSGTKLADSSVNPPPKRITYAFWPGPELLLESSGFHPEFDPSPPVSKLSGIMKRGFFEPSTRARYAPETPRALRSRTNRKESGASPVATTTDVPEPNSIAVEIVDLNPLRRVRRGASRAKVRTAIRAVKKYRRLSKHLLRQCVYISGDDDVTALHMRNPRCVWSPIEDQLLVICRVASVLLSGVRPREYMCVPYTLVRDILSEYTTVPEKSPLACGRRVKFILFNKCTETLAANILLTRVSSRPELQKYSCGRAKWHEIYKASPNEGHRLFREVVERIITEFAPRLNRMKKRKRRIRKQEELLPCIENDKPAEEELRLQSTDNMETARLDLNHSSRIPTIYVKESREAVESTYDLVCISAPQTVQGLEDMGTSRASVAVYTLYNYILSSYRFPVEVTKPFNFDLFTRILRQYPRLQLSDTVSLLLLSRVVTQMKYNAQADDEYRVVNSTRLKHTSRYEHWATYELIIQVKHIKEMCEVLSGAVTHLTRPLSDPKQQQPRPVAVQTTVDEDNAIFEEPCEKLYEHAFSSPTRGGVVACYLDFMMFEQVIDLHMFLNLSDITFMGDKSMNSAVNSYYEKQSKAKNKESDQDTPTQSDPSPLQTVYPGTRLVNRTFLSQLHQSPACFADTNFWVESGYNRRARWFDHRLSFAGGQIIAVYWPQTDHSIDSDASFQSWYKRMTDHIDSIIDRVVTLGPKPMADVLLDEQNRVIVDPVSTRVGTATITTPSDGGSDNSKATIELKSSVERFVAQGRITGRTPSDIRTKFTDESAVSTALRDLLSEEKVFWLGSTVSRFVHKRHVRLWMVHVKPGVVKSNPQLDDLSEENSVLNNQEVVEPDCVSPRPPRKRPRLDSLKKSHSSENLTQMEPPKPQSPVNDAENEDLRVGLFFPDQWLSEDGRPKPRALCGFLQAILSQLVQSAGTTLKNFAPQYRLFFGEQSIRRLLFWLRDMGAVRILRTVQQQKAALFSPDPSYDVSDKLELASAEELTLIPTPHCLAIVGSFCERYLARVGDNFYDAWMERV